jgi:hypothetical protein
MALTLDQGAKVVADVGYQARIRDGMVRWAVTVKGQQIGSLTSAVYAKRQAQAYRCLNSPSAEIGKFLEAVASDAAASLTWYPLVNIASSTGVNPSVVTTAAAHGLVVGDVVEIVGHATNTNINGVWTIATVATTTTFTVPNPGNGTGTASGTVMKMESDVTVNFTIQNVFNAVAGVIPDE